MSLPARSTLPHATIDGGSFEHWAIAGEVDVLPRIFEDYINIAVMRRGLSEALASSAMAQCQTQRAWQIAWLGQPGAELKADLLRQLPDPEAAEILVEDIQTLAEAMACLFETDSVGIRLRLLDAAMCPRFHCDNLPVRLVTTYVGPGSEWLPEAGINRAGLGAPSSDKPEVLRDPQAIQQLQSGDLALLKGSGWIGNEASGLVHRSPALVSGQKRLLVTMDPA
ncbi:DUF1826 domain-containing protein [Halomonas huangheensis]|uniref:Succinylglutamate desuccinylase n=1 Tax=Halomonas huangheensis TaxID=1178482 RepID=W1NAD6_9GAMM|nr:DUF1826 domain-containing protein [Halomonas huangheensis]ALM53642.1 hypothetical protein AR456_16190 [Halomonas huangheensis]ERL52458.1 hypothetical protein BJB45_10860 [Halomonas huangheensis]